MPDFEDSELRAAALAKVGKLSDAHAGRIPRSALMEGFQLHGRRIPLWNPQQGIYKPAVLGADGAALSIQTSFESPYDDEHDLHSGRIVYKYRGTDPNHHDNAALRRAMNRQTPLIYFVAVDPGVYEAISPTYVVDENAANHQYVLLADSAVASGYPEDALTLFVRREWVTRTVLQRLHQREFRRIVLAAYRKQCAICRLRHMQLLDAAHILRDRHPRGEAAVPNGVGLCKIHHSAFDADIIGIDPEARVHVRQDVLEEKDGPMLRYGIQGVQGAKLRLPRSPALQPNREFLAERFERFLAA